jgi:hypothetical protein
MMSGSLSFIVMPTRVGIDVFICSAAQTWME